MLKRILLVDDHAVVRSGLRLLINSEYPQVYIDEAENEDECIAKIKLFSFDLVILDLNMPDSDSLSIVKFLNQRYPHTRTLIITMSNEEIFALRFFQEGVKGFVNKSCNNQQILQAINVVLNGKTYISDNLMRKWAEKQIEKDVKKSFDILSQREFQIALDLIKGKTIQEISVSLNISASTVSTYKGKIYDKLDIPNHNLSRLIELARETNLI
ncbi:response regulator [Sediminibacterium goheungense]|uniref:LuxR family two component transcriptional regulator n=1 Tax=Sediminibacterium goheungense TaxID=1086393 RepID=A0A4V3C4S2_9BACT|nr:response regulator transcription factor [Sediminibacterium goheungense]TDO27018.1 LuxR family two component transcriptional regulator [Sediminibacterium goheungense]